MPITVARHDIHTEGAIEELDIRAPPMLGEVSELANAGARAAATAAEDVARQEGSPLAPVATTPSHADKVMSVLRRFDFTPDLKTLVSSECVHHGFSSC